MNSMKTITFKTNKSKSNDKNQLTNKSKSTDENQLTIKSESSDENHWTNNSETNDTFHLTKFISQVTNDPDIDEYTTDIW